MSARNREEGQTRAIQNHDEVWRDSLNEVVQKENDGTAHESQCGITPVSQRSRRNVPDQDVTDDATAKSCGKGENYKPEEVEVAADGRCGTFDGEKERTCHVRGEEDAIGFEFH